MKICVQGLWHLGSVTAASMASVGHDVVGLDFDEALVEGLKCGNAPLHEPGLDELILKSVNSDKLRFSTDRITSLSNIELLWVTYDTPVDDDDEADTFSVLKEIEASIEHCPQNTIVVISSQLPVGSTECLEKFAKEKCPNSNLSFACSPENLRLGKALEVFLNPDRVIMGYRSESDRSRLKKLLLPITDQIEWMSVESAEMTKHAINAFLAMSITFANEIASICEKVGANAKEVERGLKTEQRIGYKAYISPGAAFAGGTLARDINFLKKISIERGLSSHLLSSVKPSNDYHKTWARRRLLEQYKNITGKTIGIWGLTYKPGTNTLRRSYAVELCNWLLANGAKVKIHDPIVKKLPDGWQGSVIKCDDPLDVIFKADALIVATEWPIYREVKLNHISDNSPGLLVLDANRFIVGFNDIDGIKYASVGSKGGV